MFEGHPAVIAVLPDVSALRAAEARLRASEERSRMLIEEAHDASLIGESDTNRPVIANEAAERLFGVSRDQILEGDPTRFYARSQPDGRTVAQSYAEHLGSCEDGRRGQIATADPPTLRGGAPVSGDPREPPGAAAPAQDQFRRRHPAGAGRGRPG